MMERQDLPPAVNLRVPGQWSGLDQFLGRLPSDSQWREPWLRVEDLPPVVLDWKPADKEFAQVFEISCRRPPLLDEIDRVQNYAHNACIQGIGGSLSAARHLLRAGGALIRAGGAGVFIDNGAISHGAADWLNLEKHCHEALAIFYAFVNITRSARGYTSYGMHIVGQADCFIQSNNAMDQAEDAAALRTMEDFLRLAAREQRVWTEDEEFHDENGRRFVLRAHAHVDWLKEHNPMWNPYGRWELVDAC